MKIVGIEELWQGRKRQQVKIKHETTGRDRKEGARKTGRDENECRLP